MTQLDYTDPIPVPPRVTSGSGLQNYTDPTGDIWIAQNGVYGGQWKRARDALRAKYVRNAAWTMTTTSQWFSYDTMQFDPYSIYSSGGQVMTVPLAGIWRYYHKVACANTAYIVAGTYLSGVRIDFIFSYPAASWCVAVSTGLYVAGAGQPIQVQQQGSGTFAGATGLDACQGMWEWVQPSP